MDNKYLFQMKLSEILWPNPKKSTKLSLLEMTRAAKEKVELKHLFDDLEGYASTPARFFVHFTTKPKDSEDPYPLGINTKSKFSTPIGIYAYPLTEYKVDMWRMNRLPFAGDRPYVHIFTIHGNVIELDESGNSEQFGEQELEAAIDKLSQNIPQDFKKTGLSKFYAVKHPGFLELLEQIKQEFNRAVNNLDKSNSERFAAAYNQLNAELWKKQNQLYQDFENSPEYGIFVLQNFADQSKLQTPFGKLWNITRLLAGEGKAVQWNKILRSLGIDAVVDYGSSLIHPSEPVQVAVLNPSAAEMVETEKNPHSSEKNNKKQEKSIQQVKTLIPKLWKANLSLPEFIKKMSQIKAKHSETFEDELFKKANVDDFASYIKDINLPKLFLENYKDIINLFKFLIENPIPNDYIFFTSGYLLRENLYNFIKDSNLNPNEIQKVIEDLVYMKQTLVLDGTYGDEVKKEINKIRKLLGSEGLESKLKEIFSGPTDIISALEEVQDLWSVSEDSEIIGALKNKEVEEAFKNFIHLYTLKIYGIGWIKAIMNSFLPQSYYSITAKRVSEELIKIIKNKNEYDDFDEIFWQLEKLEKFGSFKGVKKWFEKELKGEIQF